MSHKATHWLAGVAPDRMTHGEFRIMFHLCDCHNPSQGCYPSQEYLRAHTGLSNGGLNKALGALEEKRLLRRERQTDAQTKRRTSTRYILGCDKDLTQEPTPLSGDGANSTFDAKPTPLLAQSHLHPSGDKPVKEPVKEPCAADATHSDFDFQSFLDRFNAAHPRPGSRKATEAELLKVIEAGADPEQLIKAARAYRAEEEGNEARFVKLSENWLRDGRWKNHASTSPKADEATVLANLAAALKAGQSWVASTTSAQKARKMIALGLVTEAECKAVGVL